MMLTKLQITALRRAATMLDTVVTELDVERPQLAMYMDDYNGELYEWTPAYSSSPAIWKCGNPGVAQSVVELLQKLGYKVTIRELT